MNAHWSKQHTTQLPISNQQATEEQRDLGTTITKTSSGRNKRKRVVMPGDTSQLNACCHTYVCQS